MIGRIADAAIAYIKNPAQASKNLLRYSLVGLATLALLIDVGLLATAAASYAQVRSMQADETRWEMQAVGDNDLTAVRAMFMGVGGGISGLKNATKQLRIGSSNWQLSNAWYGNNPPKTFRITRRLVGPVMYVTVAYSGAPDVTVSQPLLGYDETGKMRTSIPLVLVCRDGKYAKCNGAPPRTIGYFRL